MTFYHGTNEEAWTAIQVEGRLFGRQIILDEDGKPSEIFKPDPVTYLAVEQEEAATYGPVVLEVEYEPGSGIDNYCDGCWQLRVYSPIPISKIKRIV